MFRWRSFLAGIGRLLFKHLQLEHLTGLKLLARVLHRTERDFSRWELMGLYGAEVGLSSHVPLPFDDRLVSSHVDLGPTVLQRLGMPVPQAFTEGLPLGDPGLARRRTYRLGVGYLGAELMHQEGRFLAHAPIRQACESATTDALAGAELQPHARCNEIFEPLRAVHLEAMKRLCVP